MHSWPSTTGSSPQEHAWVPRAQRSGYYAWKATPKSLQAQADEALKLTPIPRTGNDLTLKSMIARVQGIFGSAALAAAMTAFFTFVLLIGMSGPVGHVMPQTQIHDGLVPGAPEPYVVPFFMTYQD